MSELLVEYPAIADADTVAVIVQGLHRKPEDFEDGDLLERIHRYWQYELRVIAIAELDLDEFDVDEDLVEDFASRESEPPPIVFDGTSGSVIDGIHRANGRAKRGCQSILAYVSVGTPCDADDDEETDDET